MTKTLVDKNNISSAPAPVSVPWVEALILWYANNKRALPWRIEKSVYRVWVAEVMSQQTTLTFLIPKFNEFIKMLPTVESLARCPDEKLRQLWQGLGYYARARNLQKAARIVVDEWGGRFPTQAHEWLKLPGCGPYTAAAICSVCFDEPVASVDGNVIRVVSRLLGLSDNVWTSEGQKRIHAFAQHHVLRRAPGDFNQGLMELGATLCKKQNPECGVCPVQSACLAFSQRTVAECPPPKPRREMVATQLCSIVFKERSKDCYFIGLRKSGFLSATVGFGVGSLQEVKNIFKNVQKSKFQTQFSNLEFKHTITHHKITSQVCLVEGEFRDLKPVLGNFFLETTPVEQPLESSLSTSFDRKAWQTLLRQKASLFSIEP